MHSFLPRLLTIAALLVSLGCSAPDRPGAQAMSHDLRDALDAVLAGRPVVRPVTPAVGCFIPSLTPKETNP